MLFMHWGNKWRFLTTARRPERPSWDNGSISLSTRTKKIGMLSCELKVFEAVSVKIEPKYVEYLKLRVLLNYD